MESKPVTKDVFAMRSGGILLPIFSLPSPHGIGTLGAEARRFVDFLADAGQRYWQILPVCPTSYGDSPYSSFSTFAGNPYFIDLDQLALDGLLTSLEIKAAGFAKNEGVDYADLFAKRFPLLRKAFTRFEQQPPEDFADFCADNPWLEDYALFMVIKDDHAGASWLDWPEDLRRRWPEALERVRRDHARDLEFWRCVQYLFFRQWRELKRYANDRGVQIIGDLPIYVALDSVDVWAAPEQFQLDEALRPTEVAGCPPDGFTADGQLWGNPLYDWERMRQDGYGWWMERFRRHCEIYDVVRIDHFRGFEAYYAIPYGDATARNGRWREGPGLDFFRAVERHVGKPPIIAEDLGFLTDGVRQLLRDTGFPGMKVLEFAFDSREDSDYLPHNYTRQCVCYTGTHDNSTVLGWAQCANPDDVRYATEYLRATPKEGLNWAMMRGAWSSVADLAVVQMQDVLGLDDSARINTPSTVGENWRWRMDKKALTPQLAGRLRREMEIYRRL